MQDPSPENIVGEKRVIHRVNHQIHWGHVALAVALILLLVQFGPPLLEAVGVDTTDEEQQGGF